MTPFAAIYVAVYNIHSGPPQAVMGGIALADMS